MSIALVTTTIHIPHVLADYAMNFQENRFSDVEIIVAADTKTPSGAEILCEGIESKTGIKTTYLSPDSQDALAPAYSSFLGWKTIQRRNLAILDAYKKGHDYIVTVDDDNIPSPVGNYLGEHLRDLTGKPQEVVTSESGWYNVCERLGPTKGFYPRGYSIDMRGKFDRCVSVLEEQNIVVNAGLWLGDPDIDAITRLALNPVVTNVHSLPFILGKGTYCPFNSQNTLLHRKVIPAYCMVSGVGRYDDIIASFIVKRIADHLSHSIRFGEPVVHQKRNAHDIWKDLDAEILGMRLTDRIVKWLRGIELNGADYAECLSDLLPKFRKCFEMDGSLTHEERLFLFCVIGSYNAWIKAIA